ncbi:MAG: Peptidase [Gemmatimonadetes bacterium]|nr:Peptidase [Gemmatimonadota bacterium]
MPWPTEPYRPVIADPPRRRRTTLGAVGGGLLFCVATILVVQFLRPSDSSPTSPFSRLSEALSPSPAPATASPALDAFGNSRNVKVHFSMPNKEIDFPLDRNGVAADLQYQWIRFGDSTSSEPPRPLTLAHLVAPPRPGFYHLAVVNGLDHDVIEQPVLGVIVPFDQKVAGRLNGYNIGTYIAERAGRDDHERPDGFVEVRPEVLDLQVTKHLKLADFVTHDEQGDVWPKYVVLNRHLLDKLELIMHDLGEDVRPGLTLDVHSGFRTPQHNARVPRAAEDSRHQYGDAADITIDADGDGKITMTDELLVMLAVDRVEAAHPDLVGGLGLYMGKRFPVPYLHIDVRGKRTRWKG